MSIELQRNRLLDIYNAALNSVNGRQLVRDVLAPCSFNKPLCIISVGKAAPAMAKGAIESLGQHDYTCLLISKDVSNDPEMADSGSVTSLLAGHPVPDKSSLIAGATMVDFIRQSSAETEFLFLISGGASSLVEVLPAGVNLQDINKINQWLLASGLNIAQINAVRKSLSCIKGGRLAREMHERNARVLLISDVPDDDPEFIGSGLLVADTQSNEILASLALPAWIRKCMSGAPTMPALHDACFNHIDVSVLASNKQARASAADKARSLGYDVFNHNRIVTGDVAETANQVSNELIRGGPGVYIWGGETTMVLPEQPGRGGRNQHLALELARLLESHKNIVALVAATDGSDGPTHDAGGLVDSGTVQRGREKGMAVEDYLRRADSGTYLDAVDDLITTGPTNTNVMDLIIAVKLES